MYCVVGVCGFVVFGYVVLDVEFVWWWWYCGKCCDCVGDEW